MNEKIIMMLTIAAIILIFCLGYATAEVMQINKLNEKLNQFSKDNSCVWKPKVVNEVNYDFNFSNINS
jgi:hypothetical protein